MVDCLLLARADDSNSPTSLVVYGSITIRSMASLCIAFFSCIFVIAKSAREEH